MSNIFKLLGVLAVAGTLSACGETAAEQAATGAVIGGAIGAITGEDVVNSALIGGAIGATGVACSVAPGTPNCI